MTKLKFGISVLFALFTINSYAATITSSKNDSSAPRYYNSGVNFGLASYNANADIHESSDDDLNIDDLTKTIFVKIIYG